MKMTKERFQEIVREAEIDPEDVRYDYSGRYMYGRTCPGITGSISTFGRFIAAAGIIERTMDEDDDGPDFSSLELADDVSTDSMGRSDSIYYWSSLELTED